MTKAAQKLTLTPPRDHPSRQACPSRRQCPPDQGWRLDRKPCRRHRAPWPSSVAQRPDHHEEAGEETGAYGVQAGGRRLRALQLLVKQKKLAKNAPIPALSAAGVLSKPTVSPRTPNAKPCIRSINSGPSRLLPTKAKAKKPSPPPSASARRS